MTYVEVYVCEPVRRVIKTEVFGRDPSSRIGQVCDRYLEVVAQDMPALSQNEWVALIDYYNGTDRGPISVQCLAHDVREGIEMDGLADRWEIDGDDLCNRLLAMTFGQRTAIMEVIDRFWSEYGGKSVDRAEALAAIGAKIAR
jgi:hypothetical protein